MRKTTSKLILTGILLSLSALFCFAQQNHPRLIVRIDDMGAFHSVNKASIDAYKNGIATSIEVMPVTPWFPEAVKMLKAHPGADVGVHLTITSEWENMKWRPLTHCPSLTDDNGYFYPMMSANPAYPGQSILENSWSLTEIEKEFRAQIELGLKNIPQITHLTGHMGVIRFDEKVLKLVHNLANEYNLTFVESPELREKYNVIPVGYDGSNATAEKESSFIRMLNNLEAGKNYIFLDHPAYNNDEVASIGHIGYEWVGEDRQGVTDMLTSNKVKQVIKEKNIELITYNELTKALPRSTPKAEKVNEKGINNFLEAIRKDGHDLHSLMVVRNGKVIAEHWLGNYSAKQPHVMYSVSKTYTASAIGFAVAEGKIKVTDKVISFFPDKLPAKVSDNLKEMEIHHLLTMNTGHENPPAWRSAEEKTDWVEMFLNAPVDHKPGSYYAYNSMATYMLSAIIQKVTGEKLINYLYPRLFRPLGIAGAVWQESPQGINTGGWGLFVKTEDMAKLGQLFLQKGKWNGKQILPESWIETASSYQTNSLPAGSKPDNLKVDAKTSDWVQGYGYQMWRCRYNAYRADGANGQFIIVIPDKNAVIAMTANIGDMQAELNLVWKYLLPALK